MPNVINRGRAVAGIVTAAHREELLEMKRVNANLALIKAEKPSLDKLKSLQGENPEA